MLCKIKFLPRTCALLIDSQHGTPDYGINFGGSNNIDVVAVQVGTGVYVFFDDDGSTSASADSVVFLANTSLLQISEANIKVVAPGS